LLVLAFATVCIVWGSTYLAIRVALEGFPPFFIGAVRFVLAGAALFALARARGEATPSRKEWAASMLTGALFFVVGNGLVNLAERSVSSGLVSVLVATMPLWATVFARAFGTAPTRRELAGLALGLVGDLRASPGGALLALLAPMGWAMGSVVSQRLPAPGLMRTAAQMICGGLAMLLISAVTRESFGAPSARAVFALAYLSIAGSLAGFTAYSYLLEHTRPAVATSYAYVNPVIAVALGVIFGGERFGLQSAAGAIVVLAAVALVQRRESASRSRSTVAVGSWEDAKRSTTPSSTTTT
jgi:drug/metabolite transporter (DMT)-like permease